MTKGSLIAELYKEESLIYTVASSIMEPGNPAQLSDYVDQLSTLGSDGERLKTVVEILAGLSSKVETLRKASEEHTSRDALVSAYDAYVDALKEFNRDSAVLASAPSA